MGLFREIRQAAAGHGHDCICDDCMALYHDGGRRGFDRVMGWRLAVSAALFIVCLASGGTLPWLAAVTGIAAILCAGYDVFIRAAANVVRRRRFDESLLMSVVAVVSVIIGRAPEGAAVMLLYQLGELLRGYAASQVRRSIDGLAEGRSQEADAVLADVRAGRGEKGHTEDFIDHFARVYTPVLLCIAVLIAVISPLLLHTTVSDGIYRALVLLVIACPCAIVISVPLSYYAGVGGAARQSILFKSTAAMEAVSRTSTVVFDKTGALTGRGLRVVAVKSDRMEADVLLRIAAHACAYSDGVYAEGIKAAYRGTIYIELIQSFRQEEGRGITVTVDGVGIVLGTADFVREHGVDPEADVLRETSAYLAIDGKYAGRILFGSVARPDVMGAVTVLSWERDRRIAMVTEDSQAAAEKFARSVGITEYYHSCRAEEKLAALRELRKNQGRRGALMFVGDAGADVECIREADVGAALNGASSDAALTEADIVILDDAPSRIVTALEAAGHTRAIVLQNILFTLAFKLIILALDMLGLCPLWLAVFADVGVALLAILNSLRAFLIKDTVLPDKTDSL